MGEIEPPLDSLAAAAREVLAAWDADDVMEKNDLGDRLWLAIGNLREAVRNA